MKILYFAWLRERIGTGRETLELPDSLTTAAELIDWLKAREARYAAAFEDPSVIRIAIDQVQAEPDASILGAREIAFFPPVTGG
ncbi:MAG: molybdopterin converting factor subunit 1 [Neomegalonema sp.]|nr:molybdopterin converting factor subunit 1 [Neomegalonema sp.]